MKRKSLPSYLPHKQSGRARAVWTDPLGVRRDHLLPGAFNSKESRTAYRRLLLELESSPHHVDVAASAAISIAELLLAYVGFATGHYRHADGRSTSELYEVKIVVRAVHEMYGNRLVAEFGPLAVKAIRQQWVNEGRTRTECNRRVGIIKRILMGHLGGTRAPGDLPLRRDRGRVAARTDGREGNRTGWAHR